MYNIRRLWGFHTMKLRFFDSINIEIPKNDIYKRLGYKDGITKLSLKQKDETEKYIRDAVFLLELKGVAGVIPIKEKSFSHVILATGDRFNGTLLASLVEKCDEVLLMGVTAGKKIIEAIQVSRDKNLTSGVVLDAVASESTDACFDWIQNLYNQELSRKNRRILSKRISCGYSDFSGEYQKTIYDILELKRLGLTLTKSFMLVPEKSATAITGIIGKENE